MPHVVVKLIAGKSERDKTRLVEAITRDVMEAFGYGEESVSVALEEVQQGDWMSAVYEPDIAAHWDQLYKKPGYGPRS